MDGVSNWRPFESSFRFDDCGERPGCALAFVVDGIVSVLKYTGYPRYDSAEPMCDRCWSHASLLVSGFDCRGLSEVGHGI